MNENQNNINIGSLDEHQPFVKLAGSTQSNSVNNSFLIEGEAPKVMYSALFTTIPVFMAYSGLVVLQEGLKRRIGIHGKYKAYIFGIAVGNLYIGNLLFRMLHNVFFTFLKPRQRVMLSYLAMVLAFVSLIVPYYIFGFQTQFFVFMAYLIGGLGIGTFESNVISSLTPLGSETKSWAIVGITIGFNFVSVGSFVFYALLGKTDGNQLFLYCVICASNILGLIFYTYFIPNIHFESSDDNFTKLIKDFKVWREWFPLIWKHCACMTVNMFCVSLFSSLVLYVYHSDPLPIYPGASKTIPASVFLGVYYLCSFVGDFISRRVAYRGEEHNPFLFLILSVTGAVTIACKISIFAPYGYFLVMFGCGSIYAHSTRYIDAHVSNRYNLVALSTWLFIGDFGAYIGSQLIQPMRTLLGVV